MESWTAQRHSSLFPSVPVLCTPREATVGGLSLKPLASSSAEAVQQQ